jgi:hypothetical protein
VFEDVEKPSLLTFTVTVEASPRDRPETVIEIFEVLPETTFVTLVWSIIDVNIGTPIVAIPVVTDAIE